MVSLDKRHYLSAEIACATGEVLVPRSADGPKRAKKVPPWHILVGPVRKPNAEENSSSNLSNPVVSKSTSDATVVVPSVKGHADSDADIACLQLRSMTLQDLDDDPTWSVEKYRPILTLAKHAGAPGSVGLIRSSLESRAKGSYPTRRLNFTEKDWIWYMWLVGVN
jgi:hypothetical protein